MKQILTLLLAASTFGTLHAQSREESRRVILGGGNETSRSGDRDVILGGGNGNSRYPQSPNGTYGNDRQYQIDQVNREYDAKIYSIRNNPHLSNQEKERTIRQLERDRQRRVNDISRRSNNDRNYEDDRYERRDNGKHKGWYKKNKNKNWKKGKRDRDWDDD